MGIGDRCLNLPDEVVLGVSFNMSLVAEIRFVSLLRPFTILASSGLGFFSSRDVALGMTGVRCYESGILDDSLLHLISFSSELIQELFPDGFVLAGFYQSLAKQPHGCIIGDDFCCP